MPTVDYYIFWNTVTGPKYRNDRAILRPNVEMNCNDNFMRLIFWTTRNAKVIALSSAIPTANKKKWRISRACVCVCVCVCGGVDDDAEKEIVFHGH